MNPFDGSIGERPSRITALLDQTARTTHPANEQENFMSHFTVLLTLQLDLQQADQAAAMGRG